MLLFFDTETTGLPDWRSPSYANHQPHLVQIAALLCDDDGNEVEDWQTIVKPKPGAVFAPEAVKAHGITPERAMAEGVDLEEAWSTFSRFIEAANGIVGHNVSFDIRIMRIAGFRVSGEKWESPLPHRCTMRMADKIMKLPPTEKMKAAGFTKSKPPNLTECMNFFFNEPLEGAHDAMTDVRACKRVYFAIKERAAK